MQTAVNTDAAQTERGRRQPYMLGKVIEAIKDAVGVEDYLHALGVEVRHGRARCPVHGGDNPQSLAIHAEGQRWRCYRCDESGDVLDLYRAVEGGEVWEAVQALRERFGVDLPQRPERWHQHQDHKAAMREEMRKGLAKVYQRRLYRMLRDAGAHVEDDAALWEAIYPAAYLAATERVFG